MLLVFLLASLEPGLAADAVAVSPSSASATAPAVAPDALIRYDAIRVALSQDRLDDARAAAHDLASADAGLSASAVALAQGTDLLRTTCHERHPFSSENSRSTILSTRRMRLSGPGFQSLTYFGRSQSPMRAAMRSGVKPKNSRISASGADSP